MRQSVRLLTLAALIGGWPSAHADLNVTNPTLKPTLNMPAPGVADVKNLPPPPPAPTGMLPAPRQELGATGQGPTGSSKAVDDLKHLYVSAILGNVAILRVGAGAQAQGGMPGQQGAAAPGGALPGVGGMAGGASQGAVAAPRRAMYQVESGVPFKLDDLELVPTVTDRTVSLSAGKKGRVVFLGSVDSVQAPVARITDVSADNAFAKSHVDVSTSGSGAETGPAAAK